MAKEIIDKKDKKRVYNIFHFFMSTCEYVESAHLGFNSPMAAFRINDTFKCEEKRHNWIFIDANDYSAKTIIFHFNVAKRLMANENLELNYNEKTGVLKYNGKEIENFEDANNYLNERFSSQEKTVDEIKEFNDNYDDNLYKIANLGKTNIIVKVILPKGLDKKETPKSKKARKVSYTDMLNKEEQDTAEATLVLAK